MTDDIDLLGHGKEKKRIYCCLGRNRDLNIPPGKELQEGTSLHGGEEEWRWGRWNVRQKLESWFPKCGPRKLVRNRSACLPPGLTECMYSNVWFKCIRNSAAGPGYLCLNKSPRWFPCTFKLENTNMFTSEFCLISWLVTSGPLHIHMSLFIRVLWR